MVIACLCAGTAIFDVKQAIYGPLQPILLFHFGSYLSSFVKREDLKLTHFFALRCLVSLFAALRIFYGPDWISGMDIIFIGGIFKLVTGLISWLTAIRTVEIDAQIIATLPVPTTLAQRQWKNYYKQNKNYLKSTKHWS